jgi:superfamily II DNA or RNA helicase
MDDRMIHTQLLNSYLKYAKGKKGIIYSISRKHSEHILNKFKEANISIVSIDSRTTKVLRENYVKRFRAGEIKIIVNVDIFSEGFDCPDIEFIQLARPTKSLVKFLQQIGRGLRPAKGIQKCIILDNVGDYFEFGLPDEERDWNLFYNGSEQIKGSRISGKKEKIERTIIEPLFDEGNEELVLISEAPIISQNISESKREWTENDDVLLKTLYIERNCPIDVISLVFKRNEEEVQVHIKELGLIKI